MKKRFLILLICLISLLLLFLLYTPDIPLNQLTKKYASTESNYLEINGLNIHYRDQGEGMPILLIHGTASSLHTWDEWTNELKPTHRVIRLDLPGFGLTGPNDTGDYSLGYYVDFVDSFLTRLNIDTVILVGNSLGGNIAWRYAAAYPKEVKKLILIDPSGFPKSDGIPWIFKLARIPVLNQILKHFTPRSIIEKNINEVYFDDSKITETLIDRYYDLALREGNRQAFIDRAKLDFDDDTELLEKIECPTLIIWGANDEWISVKDGTKFENKITDARLLVMEKTGHVPMEERPLESLKLTQAFLVSQ